MNSGTPAPNAGSTGVLYAASTQTHLDEARASRESLHRLHPGMAVALLIDSRLDAGNGWTRVIHLPATTGTSRDKLHMDLSPWEHTLFLDTDTRVCGRLDDAFQILDRFDLAAVQSSSGFHYSIPGLPNSFPEINSGVMSFRNTPAVRVFFQNWRRLYDELAPGQNGRVWDQKSLRLAVYQSDLRFACLPMEYNLMPYGPANLMQSVRILHGRPEDLFEHMEIQTNRQLGPRVWIPGAGCLHHPADAGLVNWLRPLLVGCARWTWWKARRIASHLRQIGAPTVFAAASCGALC